MAATSSAFSKPKRITVNRSEFRERLKEFLDKTTGNTLIVVTSPGGDEQKYVIDSQYFDELWRQLQSAIETLEITSDPELYAKLLRAAARVQEDYSRGRLHLFEEAFEEN